MRNPLLPLLLALIHAASGLIILLLSSWFIAACAVAGANFNYMLPAVAIRGLALLRIGSGYADMWLSHHQLLHNLAQYRLSLFQQLENTQESLRANHTDKLNYQTQDLASIWVGWINQNASALVSLLLVSVFVLYAIPVYSAVWFAFVACCLSIYGWLIISGIKTSKLKLAVRARLESEIEHHIDSAQLWHMREVLNHPNCAEWYELQNQNRTRVELAINLLLGCGLVATLYTLHLTNTLTTSSIITPMALVLPMALLASQDWFGRIFYTEERLQDFLVSKPFAAGKTGCLQKRIDARVTNLQLNHFNVTTETRFAIDLSLNKPGLVLLSGSSGTGKTRLLKAIAGLLPHTGSKWVNNRAISEQVILDDVLYIEQHPYCLSGTLGQNLQLADANASDTLLRDTLNKAGLTQLVDLDEWLGAGGRNLSGGELKRLGLARALLSDKSIVLFDEPFEALDPENITAISAVINQLKNKKIVVIASHVLPDSLSIDANIDLDSHSQKPIPAPHGDSLTHENR